jgi:purine-binding chemotaxis protein CheW
MWAVMNGTAGGLAQRAADMRSSFDAAFAAPRRPEVGVKTDLLAVRAGDEAYAIRLSEVGGLFSVRKITRVPGGHAALLGIAGFRGALVPVYNLRAALGLAGTRTPRWLVLAAAAPVALAFDVFEGHLRVPADAITPQQSQAASRFYAPDFIRTEAAVRPVLHLDALIGALGASGAPERSMTAPHKE